MIDPYNLQRFVDAQSGVYEQVCSQLRRGRKTSHWMWFIFPQITGLGQSPMAVRYAIASMYEARAYLKHPVLGLRLMECCELLLTHTGTAVEQIMGYPDDLKLKSSMTLFAQTLAESERNAIFTDVLETFFNGELDGLTLSRL